jgi:hypothetical protein
MTEDIEEHKMREMETKAILGDFEDFLHHHKQVSPRTANAHLERVTLFAEAYFNRSREKSVLDVCEFDIQD